MPFRELKGKNERAFYDIRIQQLTAIYRDSQAELKRIVRSADSTDFAVARANELLAQTREEIRKLDFFSRRWVSRNVPAAYRRGAEFAQERLRALNVARRVDLGAQIHRTAVNVVADQMTLDLLTANGTIARQVGDFLRRTQQKYLEERQINKNIAQGLVQGESRRTTSDRLYQDLRDRMREDKFIQIRGRNYEPKSYAELVARTRTREATTKGTINSTLQYGLDLVQVSVHEGPCDICRPFQGKIYSISGADQDFPPLKEEPPFHPNCRHVLVPVTRTALEDRGQLSTLRTFSRSRTEVNSFAQFEEILS